MCCCNKWYKKGWYSRWYKKECYSIWYKNGYVIIDDVIIDIVNDIIYVIRRDVLL